MKTKKQNVAKWVLSKMKKTQCPDCGGGGKICGKCDGYLNIDCNECGGLGTKGVCKFCNGGDEVFCLTNSDYNKLLGLSKQ